MNSYLVVNSQISVPRRELRFTFVRSSGPGGQNVNKVNSKAVLRWAVASTAALPDDVRARFLAKFHRRISEEGELQLTSQRYRDQGKNVLDCIDKLRGMIVAVAVSEKKRRPTKPTRSSVRRRLRNKRETSQKKQTRRDRPRLDD